MVQFFLAFLTFFFIGCDSSLEFSDFKSSKTPKSETAFKKDLEECLYFSQQILDKPEGSKRSGEIHIENKGKTLKGMTQKGWIKKNRLRQ